MHLHALPSRRVRGALQMQLSFEAALQSMRAFFARLAADPPGAPPASGAAAHASAAQLAHASEPAPSNRAPVNQKPSAGGAAGLHYTLSYPLLHSVLLMRLSCSII